MAVSYESGDLSMHLDGDGGDGDWCRRIEYQALMTYCELFDANRSLPPPREWPSRN